jgi:hypothetical protein
MSDCTAAPRLRTPSGMTYGPRLSVGDIVWNAGHEFRVAAVRFYPDEYPGFEVMRYDGECTAHACNDSIRGTGYDGGCYGYRVKVA